MLTDVYPNGRPLKVLVAGANHWQTCIHVGSHHLTKAFRRLGFDVFYLGDPLSPFHALGGNRAEFLQKLRSSTVSCDPDSGVQYLTPFSLFTPNSYPVSNKRMVMQHWWRLCLPPLEWAFTAAGFAEVDILYLESPRYHFLLDVLKYSKSFFRVADKTCGFPGHTDIHRFAERKIARRADLTIYSASQLKLYVDELGAINTLHVPNGVDFDHIVSGQHQPVPVELQKLSGPKFLYVGTMSEWFDFDLVARAATEIPEGNFILVGPPEMAKRRLGHLPNVHILGRRSFADIPAYLWNVDVGMIPFDVKRYPDLINSVNPLKLYEYMAAKLPVVSVKWRELELLASPVRLTSSEGEFVQGLREAIALSPATSNQAYAQTRTWTNGVLGILQRLYNT